jgi:hypothetical protein
MIRCLFTAILICGVSVNAMAVPAPNAQVRIERLIKDLDNDSFRVREDAMRELLRLGVDAVPALKEALTKKPSEEVTRRVKQILQTINPVFEAHSNGWHWVYGDMAQGQTFKASGATIRELKVRVARMNRNQPAGDMNIEIRSTDLKKVYLRGSIPAANSTVEFQWHKVKLDHVGDMKEGEEYWLIFHSRGTVGKACWAVNAAYKDVYPHGRFCQHAHEDLFFDMEFTNRRNLRVGPDGENTVQKLPINSGNEGGTPANGGRLTLAGVGAMPDGETAPASKN